MPRWLDAWGMSKISPHLSLRARKRNPDGAELAVDVDARG
jgi:hypothetical protein